MVGDPLGLDGLRKQGPAYGYWACQVEPWPSRNNYKRPMSRILGENCKPANVAGSVVCSHSTPVSGAPKLFDDCVVARPR